MPVIVVGIDGNLDGKKYSSITIMNNIIIFIFQLCIILIFNKLISVAIEQKNNSITGCSLSNYSTSMLMSNVQSDNLLRSTTEPEQQSCMQDDEMDEFTEHDISMSSQSINEIGTS